MLGNICQPFHFLLRRISHCRDCPLGSSHPLRACLGKWLRNPKAAEKYIRRRFVFAGFLEVMMGRAEDAGYHLIRGFKQIN